MLIFYCMVTKKFHCFIPNEIKPNFKLMSSLHDILNCNIQLMPKRRIGDFTYTFSHLHPPRSSFLVRSEDV